MFTYRENIEQLERMEARQRELEARRSRWTEAEGEEASDLYANIGELKADLSAINRAEGGTGW